MVGKVPAFFVLFIVIVAQKNTALNSLLCFTDIYFEERVIYSDGMSLPSRSGNLTDNTL